jgi:mannose-6-phosphate isomerase-like protein (cupin superfamily)
MRRTVITAAALVAVLAFGVAIGWGAARQTAPAGYVLEHEADLKKEEPAPHKGPGRSTAYSYFERAPGFKIAFRKRVLHPGAGIGYHLQKEDEVYYVLSGTGIMQMNGEEFPVKPGDAVLTRPGSSHGIKQTGKEDLVLIINYEKK